MFRKKSMSDMFLEFDSGFREHETDSRGYSWFLKINPNGRIPAILDGNQRVFESGAIMLYLTDKYDKERKISYAPGSSEYAEELSWLMFQMGGVGPMQGMIQWFKCSYFTNGLSLTVPVTAYRPSQPFPALRRSPLRLRH